MFTNKKITEIIGEIFMFFFKLTISIGSTLIHVVIVFFVSFILLFSTNKNTLIPLVIILSLIFLQAIIANGCIISKLEQFSFINLTDLVKRGFYLEKNIKLGDIEKILIGIITLLCLFKLVIILLLEENGFFRLPVIL
jgi:hypothetical protein